MANNQSTASLGFMDLMSIAVGQIIGAGVMVMSIAALSMTGRSVNIAFMVAAVFTIFGAFPSIFVSSVIRLKGGLYTQAAVFVSPVYSGFLQYVGLLSSMSLGIFAIGLASYCGMIIPAIGANQKLWAVIFLIAFHVLNWFGTEWMAKVQGFMFYFLVAALVLFTVMGLPHANVGSYFGNELFGEPLFAHGITGLMEAASYLTFATGGATVILSFSADAKNPTKDIPRVIVISTVLVAILYAFLATVIGGVMPAADVIAIGNLAPIADMIMPKPLYYFFVIAGAGFALGTTLNSSIASSFAPFATAAADGWFPRVLAAKNKYGVPYYYMGIRFAVNFIVLVSGFDVNTIGKWSLIIGNVTNFVTALSVMRIPKLFPEAWERSPFHVSDGLLKIMLGGTATTLAIQAYMNLQGLTPFIMAINVATFVVSWGIATYLYKTGKVQMNPSYELM